MEPEQPAKSDGQPPESAPPPAAPAPQPAAPDRRPIDEDMVAQLRAGARRRRPWTPLSCFLALLVVAVPVGLLVWWFRPRPELPPLVVTAFDQVGVSGQEAVCRARLEPLGPAPADLGLAGIELSFEQVRFDAKGRGRQAKATTQAGGVAAVKWVIPEGTPRVEVTVRCVQTDRGAETPDRARLFAWPRGAKVLLVDIAALALNGDKLWQQETVPDIALRPDAAAALRAAQAAKYKVVYLATGPARSLVYRQVRNWTERTAALPGGIPAGPVLGRLSISEADAESPKATVAHLQGFDSSPVVLLGQEEAAQAYRTAGARVLVVGQGDVAWGQVAKELAK